MQTIRKSANEVYHLKQRVGSGGFSDVWLSNKGGEEVCLKRIAKNGTKINENSYKNEISALSKINHPNVIKMIDHFETESEFIIMLEYFNGRHICNPDSVSTLLKLVGNLTMALGTTHHKGFAHRDVTRKNILYGNDVERAKLIDFGLAIPLGSNDRDSEEPIFGTPKHISPERILNQKIEPQSDIYSAAISIADYLGLDKINIHNEEWTRISIIGKMSDAVESLKLPDSVNRVLNRALVANPQARYYNMGDFGAELISEIRKNTEQLSNHLQNIRSVDYRNDFSMEKVYGKMRTEHRKIIIGNPNKESGDQTAELKIESEVTEELII